MMIKSTQTLKWIARNGREGGKSLKTFLCWGRLLFRVPPSASVVVTGKNIECYPQGKEGRKKEHNSTTIEKKRRHLINSPRRSFTTLNTEREEDAAPFRRQWKYCARKGRTGHRMTVRSKLDNVLKYLDFKMWNFGAYLSISRHFNWIWFILLLLLRSLSAVFLNHYWMKDWMSHRDKEKNDEWNQSEQRPVFS